MEILGLIELPGWLLGIIIFVTTICVYTLYKQSFYKRHGIPQKPTLFFFGDMFEMSKKGFGYIDYKMVKENGKVFGTYLGNTPSLIISDTNMIKQIMIKDFPKFADRVPNIPITKIWESNVSGASGEHWKFLRSTLSPAFTSGKMREMNPYIHKCMKTLHEMLDEKIKMNPEGFDISPIIASYTLDVICSTGFGLDVDAQKHPDNEFFKYTKDMLEFKNLKNPIFVLRVFFPEIFEMFGYFLRTNLISNEAFDFYLKTLEQAFKERKQDQSKHRDLLQLLINAHKEKGDLTIRDDDSDEIITFEGMKKRGLTDVEVLVNSIIFMVAGYETTSATLSWIIYDLVLNTDWQEKLIQEIDEQMGDSKPVYDNVFKLRYLDMVVNETMRIHPPGERLNRRALEDVEINGVQIKKGMDCTFPVAALHFMPEYWENPNKYDPERFAPENKANINQYAYMPFGLGPRNCIGKRLALLEVKATIVTLLQKYSFYKTDKLKVPMPTGKTTLTRPAEPVFVRLEERTK